MRRICETQHFFVTNVNTESISKHKHTKSRNGKISQTTKLNAIVVVVWQINKADNFCRSLVKLEISVLLSYRIDDRNVSPKKDKIKFFRDRVCESVCGEKGDGMELDIMK